MSQRDDFVAIAVAQAGKLQYEFGCRCDWSCGETDCSGLVSGAAQRVKCWVGAGCPNSSALARLCHQAPRPAWMTAMFGPDPWTGSTTVGTGISKAQARATKGALKFHGLSQGQNGDGPTGHVGISLGDGRSIEALSHALDVRIWQFDDDKTTYCALLPGMTGFDTAPGANPDPSTAWEADVMGFISIAVPGAHPQAAGPAKGRTPLVAAVSSDGITWALAAFNGALLPGGKTLMSLGKLNKPIEQVGVVYAPDPEDNHSPRRLIPTRSVLWSAGDGGTFGPIAPTVRYHA